MKKRGAFRVRGSTGGPAAFHCPASANNAGIVALSHRLDYRL